MGIHSAEAAHAVLPLNEQMVDAVVMLQPYEAVRSSELPGRIGADPEAAAAMSAAADTIFDTLGVLAADAAPSNIELQLHNNFRVPPEAVRLRRAADTAAEALAFGYDVHAPEDDLRATAADIIADYIAYTTEATRTGAKGTDPRYSDRRVAKRLLAESAARELARRNGIEDDLTPASLRRTQEITGVPLVSDNAFNYHPITPRVLVVARPPRRQPESTTRTEYYVPELGGWVPARRGGSVLDARYTRGRLPR